MDHEATRVSFGDDSSSEDEIKLFSDDFEQSNSSISESSSDYNVCTLQNQIEKLESQINDTLESIQPDSIPSQLISKTLDNSKSPTKHNYIKNMNSNNQNDELTNNFSSELLNRSNKQELNRLKETNTTLKESLSKYRKKYKESLANESKLKEHLAAQKIEKDKLNLVNKSLAEENKMLKLQLEAAHVSHLEARTAWTSINNDANRLTSVIDIFEERLEAQKEEIKTFSNEKQLLIGIIQKLHNSYDMFENQIEKLQEENKKLKQQHIKQTEEYVDISKISIPFSGDLSTSCNKIKASTQFTAANRMQMIFNEINKFLSVSKPNKVHYDEKERNNQEIGEICLAFVHELKNLVLNEQKLNNIAFTNADQSFQYFMESHALQIEKIENFVIPHSISSTIFGPENQENRSKIINKVLNSDLETGTFITALFLINYHLNQQLHRTMNAATKIQNLNEVAQTLGCNDVYQIPKRLEHIQHKIQKLEEYSKKLKSALKNSKQESLNLSNTSSEIQDQVNSLTEENTSLKNQLQIVSNELLIKKNDQKSITVMQSTINSYNETISRLKQALADKGKENSDLVQENIQLKKSLDFETQRMNYQVSKQVQSMAQQLEVIQSSYQRLRLKQEKSKHNYKKKLEKIKRFYNQEIQNKDATFQQAKSSFESIITELRSKGNQVQALSKRLTDNLSESEQKKQILIEENSHLKMETQTLEAQLRTLKNKLEKEKQILETQSMAKVIAVETKHHDTITEMKAEMAKEKQKFIEYVVKEIGQFYDFNTTDIDELSFNRLIFRVKTDIQQLRRNS